MKALTVASYFLSRAKNGWELLSPLKVQKLIYLADGLNLAIKGVPLVDEQLVRSNCTYIFSSVFFEFAKYGRGSVDHIPPTTEFPDEYELALLNKVWSVFGKLPAKSLSLMSHMPGHPIPVAKSKNLAIMDREIMKQHFAKVLAYGIENQI